MKNVLIKDDFIKLGQALKLSGAVDTGVDAKYEIEAGKVTVNGESENRRGRKCYTGDIITYKGEQYVIKKFGV